MPAAHTLVAEDQTDIRDLLVLNLRGAGYEVSAVGDGEQALARQLESPADLLVLDLMMPRLDGLEVCKALRAKGSAARPANTARPDSTASNTSCTASSASSGSRSLRCAKRTR